MSLAGSTFGLTGMLIAYAASPDCGVLDLKTGSIIGLNDANVLELIKDNPTLIKKYNATDKSPSVKRAIIREVNKKYQ
jgi:hypothetical protein